MGYNRLCWGINLKRLLCGELLCGKRYFTENLMITPLGIPLICYVGESW